jgi:hypothetical protein
LSQRLHSCDDVESTTKTLAGVFEARFCWARLTSATGTSHPASRLIFCLAKFSIFCPRPSHFLFCLAKFSLFSVQDRLIFCPRPSHFLSKTASFSVQDRLILCSVLPSFHYFLSKIRNPYPEIIISYFINFTIFPNEQFPKRKVLHIVVVYEECRLSPHQIQTRTESARVVPSVPLNMHAPATTTQQYLLGLLEQQPVFPLQTILFLAVPP